MTPTQVLDIDPNGLAKVAQGDGGAVQDLPVFVADTTTFSRWTLSDEERANIAAGGDMLVAVLNRGMPLHPMVPMVLQHGAEVEAAHLEELQKEICTP